MCRLVPRALLCRALLLLPARQTTLVRSHTASHTHSSCALSHHAAHTTCRVVPVEWPEPLPNLTAVFAELNTRVGLIQGTCQAMRDKCAAERPGADTGAGETLGRRRALAASTERQMDFFSRALMHWAAQGFDRVPTKGWVPARAGPGPHSDEFDAHVATAAARRPLAHTPLSAAERDLQARDAAAYRVARAETAEAGADAQAAEAAAATGTDEAVEELSLLAPAEAPLGSAMPRHAVLAALAAEDSDANNESFDMSMIC